MTRNKALKILNPILGELLVTHVVSGPLGDELPEGAFETVHEGGGILFAALLILHPVLNWNWVKANYFETSRIPPA